MKGKIIRNRYKLIEKIGGGGMAEVYKAVDLILNKDVAVKILRQQYVNDDDFVNRFRREAQSVASLSHKNVVSIYDVGEEDDTYYIVMEYIEGSTLKELILEKEKLNIKDSIDYATKIASALEHAHDKNIIHRDIKPHNILIGINGEVKVTDFGIARAVSQATITQTGSVLGSVHYLSPEQARGGYTDEKSDIYSLGVVLYEMVTGELPFFGDSPISIALKHLQGNFIYPKDIDPSIPQSVENIILRAMMKDPTKRYQSATEMYNDLKTALYPSRINEPQIDISDEMDDEQTVIIPGFVNENTTEISGIRNRRNRERNIKGKVIVLSIFVLIFSLGALGIQNLKAKLIVPDVEIPVLEGQHIDEAIEELDSLELRYTIIEKNDPVVVEDYVIKQEPFQGSVVKATQEITLYVSLGKEKIDMPDVVTMQQRQGTFKLEQAGFKNIEIIPTYSEDAPSGTIFKQEPSVDQLVIPDETKVMLFVSKGKENFEMPNLLGKTEEEAKATLATNGLALGNIEHDYSFDQSVGRVYKQFPYDPGKDVTAGDTVDIYISKGYPEDAKTINSDILVIIYDNKDTEVSIVVNDARNKDILWIKETIDSPKFYNDIELVLTPGTDGKIRVYQNGILEQTKTVKYQ